MNKKIIYVLLILIFLLKVDSLSWNIEDKGLYINYWALNCDFPGNDIKGVASKAEECSNLCIGQNDCWSYTWGRGTCWLKYKQQNDQLPVFASDDAVCGFLKLKGSVNVEYWSTQASKNILLVRNQDLIFSKNSNTTYYTININTSIKYQTMDGFGASMTDASCWLFKYKLSDNKRREVLERVFGKSGINLSILRQPIGASDFNWESWTYDDSNNDDFNLKSFYLWREDDYIRPMLDLALSVDKGRIKVFGSPWSPPAWMKTQRNLFGSLGGVLRSDCYNAYADYFVKYINEYAKKGTNVYAITVQNEPLYAPSNYPGMLMSVQEQINFIANYLGPKFRSNNINTKIIGYDHNYDQIGIDYSNKLLSNSGASQFIAGIGFHTYVAPNHVAMTNLHNLYPSKDFWITEAGSGTWIGDFLGMFQDQMMHLIRSPRNWAKGVVFWNVALDQNSSPKLAGVDSTATNRGLITIRSDQTDFVIYEAGYYSMGHSVKFVQPGAVRIDSNTFNDDVENVAYLNPDQTIVVVISNRKSNVKSLKINWNDLSLNLNLNANEAVTLKWQSHP